MKEIERKFLLKDDKWIELLKLKDKKSENISDIYINDNTRLRRNNLYNKWVLTCKDGKGLVRDEFEDLIVNDITLFENSLTLDKLRISTEYKGNVFEINIFKDIKYNEQPLVLVEVELKSVEDKIELPEWVGTEVTEDERFYGFNLFKLLKYKSFTVK